MNSILIISFADPVWHVLIFSLIGQLIAREYETMLNFYI